MEEVEGVSPPSPPPLSSPIVSPPHSPSLSDRNEEVIGENSEDHEQDIILSGDCGLSDELRAKIVHQVEDYFSDANLPENKFLLKHTWRNGRGFVPISVIASLRKMKRLVEDDSLIEAALRTSSNLVVSKDGKKVKRINPLPVIAETNDDESRTVMVENLPENYTEESIGQTFGEVGNIVKISIRDPQSAEGSQVNKDGYLISSKVHALVEYDSVKAAKKAVSKLNNKKDWRSGLRVKLLSKTESRMFDNFIMRLREAEGGEVDSEKDDEEEEHSKGTRHNYRNEQGHGCGTVGSTSGVTNRPLPGPRIPDGTRGFTMGRGKRDCSDYKPDLKDP
ncbi:la-related protein 6A-like [Carex rostrata]